MPSLSYSAERLDSRHQCTRESRGFLLGGAARQQSCLQRGFGYPPNLPMEPSHVGNGYPASNFRSLPLIAEVDDLVVSAGDEARRLCLEPLGIPSSSRHDGRPPPTHGASPVGDEVPRLGRQSRDGIFENRRIRSARHVAPVFAVPVRQQHDHNLQAVELPAADKRVVVPGPAVFVEQHAHGSILELEACVDEAAVLTHHGARARERVYAIDAPAADVMGDLGEVAARGREPRAERFRFCFCAPFDAPQPTFPIVDGNAWMRSRQELFDEFEWRFGDVCRAARSISEVVGFLAVDVMPDAMPRGQQGPWSGAMNAPDAVQMPREMQHPEDRDGARDDNDDDEWPRHRSRTRAKAGPPTGFVLGCYPFNERC